MKVTINKNKIFLEHTLQKNETYKLDERDHIKTLTIYKKPQTVSGVSSQCNDGKQILFFDYDRTAKAIVLQDMAELLRIHNLPDIHVFKTKESLSPDGIYYGNYHCISLAKFPSSEAADIIRTTRCDQAFKSMPLRNTFRSWVLRLSEKEGSKRPSYECTLTNPDAPHTIPVSTAHKLLLEKIYPNIPKSKYVSEDEQTELYAHTYQTKN